MVHEASDKAKDRDKANLIIMGNRWNINIIRMDIC